MTNIPGFGVEAMIGAQMSRCWQPQIDGRSPGFDVSALESKGAEAEVWVARRKLLGVILRDQLRAANRGHRRAQRWQFGRAHLR